MYSLGKIRQIAPFASTSIFDKVFDDMFKDMFGEIEGNFIPTLNDTKFDKVYRSTGPYDLSYEKGEDGKPVSFELKYALAGFKKDEISLSFEDGVLNVTASKCNKTSNEKSKEPKDSKEEKTTALSRTVIHSGIARRDMVFKHVIPENADIDKVTASFEDGELTVKIPLTKQQKDSIKKIAIS